MRVCDVCGKGPLGCEEGFPFIIKGVDRDLCDECFRAVHAEVDR